MWLWGCFTPHPPIILSDIGGGREKEAQVTINGITELTGRLSSEKPDVLFILSPHSQSGRGLKINSSDTYNGDMALFGHPEIFIEVKGENNSLKNIVEKLKNGITISHHHKENTDLDHGSMIPLLFLKKEWGTLPDIIVANPSGLSLKESITLGKELRSFKDTRKWGLIASGDLSHRLTRDAPAGFSPEGTIFDQKILTALKEGDPSSILKMSPEMISEAGECGLRSALALLGFAQSPVELISYEGPFGVGYCTAIWKKTLHPSVILARQALENIFSDEKLDLSEWKNDELMKHPSACFVSLKTYDGRLRGCIGTILPTKPSLTLEIINNTIAAATSDPRFSPVEKKELDSLSISVDMLSIPEDIRSKSQLNHKKYGVIVKKGIKKGVLLPDLDGVNSVDEQLSIAASKAGIKNLIDLRVQRFTVERHGEVKNGR